METYSPKICNKPITINKTRTAAIRAHCTDCSAGFRTEVSECACVDCPLYPFRGFTEWEGKRKPMSQEQRLAASKRLKKYHSNGRVS